MITKTHPPFEMTVREVTSDLNGVSQFFYVDDIGWLGPVGPAISDELDRNLKEFESQMPDTLPPAAATADEPIIPTQEDRLVIIEMSLKQLTTGLSSLNDRLRDHHRIDATPAGRLGVLGDRAPKKDRPFGLGVVGAGMLDCAPDLSPMTEILNLVKLINSISAEAEESAPTSKIRTPMRKAALDFIESIAEIAGLKIKMSV